MTKYGKINNNQYFIEFNQFDAQQFLHTRKNLIRKFNSIKLYGTERDKTEIQL